MFNRNSTMKGRRGMTIALVLSMVFLVPAVASAVGGPVVATAAGKVKGYLVPESGVLAFKGLHYGESTAGVRRFKPPVPVKSWDSIRDATDYGPTCPQLGYKAASKSKGKGSAPVQSEDCLVLNVWTPGTEGRRPVLFWIHGGGFSKGDGSYASYDGSALAKRGDVVVISDVKALQKIPAADVVTALSTVKPGIGAFRPVVDGTFLPAPPFSKDVLGLSAGIPILIGSTKHEMLAWYSRDPKRDVLTMAELMDRLAPQYGDKTDRIVDVYSKSRPEANLGISDRQVLELSAFSNKSNTLRRYLRRASQSD